MKKLEWMAQLKNNELLYKVHHYKSGDKYFHEEFSKFKKKNEGYKIDISYTVIDTPEYHQHKFYRGGLLPAIAEAAGNKNILIEHIYLKSDFLFKECLDFFEIPEKYLKNGIYEISEAEITIERLGKISWQFVKGIILIMGKFGLRGYIPSTADLTYDEMKQYIKNCENRLFIDLSGELPEYWGRYKHENL